jgi:hypothetical protein
MSGSTTLEQIGSFSRPLTPWELPQRLTPCTKTNKGKRHGQLPTQINCVVVKQRQSQRRVA